MSSRRGMNEPTVEVARTYQRGSTPARPLQGAPAGARRPRVMHPSPLAVLRKAPYAPPMLRIELSDEGATTRLGRALAELVRPGDVIGLEGELGAGKTFLVGATVHALGVPEEVPVTSPTFALIQEYTGRYPIVHVDLYRLSGAHELGDLGLEEYLGRDGVVFVEWGRGLLDADVVTLWIELIPIAEHSRLAKIEATGARGERVAERLASSGLQT